MRRVGGSSSTQAQVEIAGDGPLFGLVAELVAAKIKFVGRGAGRHIAMQSVVLTGGERQGERLDDALGKLVLHAKQIPHRRLRSVRRKQRSGRSVCHLRGYSHFVARREAGFRSTITSTSASAATKLLSASAPKRAAMLERTTSDSRPESDAVSASGRLKARNSVSGSGRSIRKGRTIRRVSRGACGCSAADETGMRKR